MNENTYDAFGSDGPSVEPTLLIRFLLRKFDELLEREHPTISILYRALALAAVSPDETAHSELQTILFPESPIKRCQEILERTLIRFQDGDFREWKEPTTKKDTPLPERAYSDVLITALSESRKAIDQNDYEFAPIFRSLGWMSLQPYPRRLSEFEAVWESSQDDPAEAIKKGIIVLRRAFSDKDKDVSSRIWRELSCSTPASATDKEIRE